MRQRGSGRHVFHSSSDPISRTALIARSPSPRISAARAASRRPCSTTHASSSSSFHCQLWPSGPATRSR